MGDPVMIMTMWVIYDHPIDFPRHFVVRRQFLTSSPDEIIPSDLAPHGAVRILPDEPTIYADRSAHLAMTLNGARAYLPPGLERIPRMPDDDPNIVEVWL